MKREKLVILHPPPHLLPPKPLLPLAQNTLHNHHGYKHPGRRVAQLHTQRRPLLRYKLLLTTPFTTHRSPWRPCMRRLRRRRSQGILQVCFVLVRFLEHRKLLRLISIPSFLLLCLRRHRSEFSYTAIIRRLFDSFF